MEITLHHGSPIEIKDIGMKSGTFFTDDYEVARQYGEVIYSFTTNKETFLLFDKDCFNEHFISKRIIPFYFFELSYFEIWKDVPNYEGIYQISNLGRLKSLNRLINTKNQGGKYSKILKGKIIKGNISNSGYILVTLSKNGIIEKKQIHQLVAMAFLNHKTCGLEIVVDHINHIKTDNRVYNLQLISNRQNITKDQFRHNRSSKFAGVYWFKRDSKWRAQIQINKKNIHLGLFNTEEEASEAYQKALLNSI